MELNHKIPNLIRTPTPPLPPRSSVRYDEGGVVGSGRNWKLIVFDVIAVLLAAAAGYSCLLYFAGDIKLSFFVAIVAIFLMASFFTFLLAPGQRRRAISALPQILAFLAFFYATTPAVILSAFGVLVIFYSLAIQGTNAEMENSIKFRLFSLARGYMKKVFIGFALAAILLYLPQWDGGNVFVPQERFRQWYEGFANFSQSFYPRADLKADVGAFAEDIARSQLATNEQFNSLSAREQDMVVQRASQELISNTSKSIGLPLVPEMPLVDAFYEYILNFLNSLKTQFGDSFVAAWAVTLFVIVFSLGTLMIWALSIVSYLFFELLSAFNVVHTAGEPKTKEIVELS